MLYKCKRCGFTTHIKTHYIRHLEARKKPCKVKYLDIPIETLIEELEDKSTNVNMFVNPNVNPIVNNDNIYKPNVCPEGGLTPWPKPNLGSSIVFGIEINPLYGLKYSYNKQYKYILGVTI